MRLKLLLSALLFTFFSFAQSSADLKEFINKNSVAIRSVQKNMVAKSVAGYDEQFKEILKLQLSAIKLYKTDAKASFTLAKLARTECLSFLKKYSTGSVDYFELNNNEKSFSVAEKASAENVLTGQELKQISAINSSDFKSLNELPLTIQ